MADQLRWKNRQNTLSLAWNDGTTLETYIKEKTRIYSFFSHYFTQFENMSHRIEELEKICHNTVKEILGEMQRSEAFKDCIGDLIFFYLSFLDDFNSEMKNLSKNLVKLSEEKKKIFEICSEKLDSCENVLNDAAQFYQEYNSVWEIQSKKYENYCTSAEKKLELYNRNSKKAIRIFNEVEMTNEIEKLKFTIRKVLEKEVVLLELSEEFYKKKEGLCNASILYLETLETFRESIESSLAHTFEHLHEIIINHASNTKLIFEEKRNSLDGFDKQSTYKTRKFDLPKKIDIILYTDWVKAKTAKIEERNKIKIFLLKKVVFSLTKIAEFYLDLKNKTSKESSLLNNEYINCVNVIYLRYKYLTTSLEHFIEGLQNSYNFFGSSLQSLFNENKSLKNLLLNLIGQNSEYSKKSLKQSIEHTNGNLNSSLEHLSKEEFRVSSMIFNFFQEFYFGSFQTLNTIGLDIQLLSKPILYTFTFSVTRNIHKMESEKKVEIRFNKLLDLQDVKICDELNIQENIDLNKDVPLSESSLKSPRNMNFLTLEADEFRQGTFTCALSDSILLHGSLEITNKKLFFTSRFNRRNIFFGETVLLIPRSDIISVQKRKYGFLLNSLELKTKKGEILFTSFISSNKVYELLRPEEEAENVEDDGMEVELIENEEKEIEISDELKRQLEIRAQNIFQKVIDDKTDHSFTFLFPKGISVMDVFIHLFSGKEFVYKGKSFMNFLSFFKEKAYGDFGFSRTAFEPPIPQFFVDCKNPEELAEFPEYSQSIENSRHPVVQSLPFLPKECGICETQQLYFCSFNSFIHESLVDASGIPYSDTFRSKILYIVDTNSEGETRLEYKYNVLILKNSMVKGAIRSQATSDIKKSSILLQQLLKEFSTNLIRSRNKGKRKSKGDIDIRELTEATDGLEDEKIKDLESNLKHQLSRIHRSNVIIGILIAFVLYLLVDKVYNFSFY